MFYSNFSAECVSENLKKNPLRIDLVIDMSLVYHFLGTRCTVYVCIMYACT